MFPQVLWALLIATAGLGTTQVGEARSCFRELEEQNSMYYLQVVVTKVLAR